MSAVSAHYHQTMNDVLRFIDENLERDLSLECLAELALFSKYHFHRVFKAAVGENLNAYVTRRRLERAAVLMKHREDLNVTQIALEVGYQSVEHFSRSFKKKFGFTANEFRLSDKRDPESLKNSKIHQAGGEPGFYRIYEESRQCSQHEFEVHVKDRVPTKVAFCTGIFGTDGSGLVQAYLDLMAWGEDRGFTGPSMQRFAISRDDVEITPPAQYRLDFCLAVPPTVVPDETVSIKEIAGGPYALIHVVGDIQRVAQAWDHLYKHWLPFSQYVPRDEPAIENLLKGPETLGWETFDLEVGIPLMSLPKG